MARRYSPRPPISEETRERMREAQRGKTHSAKSREKMRVAKLGKPSNARKSWNELSYSGRHMRVSATFKCPGECESCGASDARMEWASIDHSYKEGREHWLRLCVTCHRVMDDGAGMRRGRAS
jgi:hypothetical protein